MRQFFCWRLVFLLQLFGARGLELGVERLDLALERAHGVDGLVDLVEQALLLAVGVLQLADDAGDEDILAAHAARGSCARSLCFALASLPCGSFDLAK